MKFVELPTMNNDDLELLVDGSRKMVPLDDLLPIERGDVLVARHPQWSPRLLRVTDLWTHDGISPFVIASVEVVLLGVV